MKYLAITHCDQLNGEGNRSVLWVSGCSHRCKNCQNQHTWNYDDGLVFDDKAKYELFKYLHEDWCSGVTLSGGDPLYENNVIGIIQLAKEIKEKFPNKTIWCYTGYKYEEIQTNERMKEILDYIDVLCDGEYIEELKDVDKHWVGSSNQNIIYLKN